MFWPITIHLCFYPWKWVLEYKLSLHVSFGCFELKFWSANDQLCVYHLCRDSLWFCCRNSFTFMGCERLEKVLLEWSKQCEICFEVPCTCCGSFELSIRNCIRLNMARLEWTRTSIFRIKEPMENLFLHIILEEDHSKVLVLYRHCIAGNALIFIRPTW